MTGFNSKRDAAADKLQEPDCQATGRCVRSGLYVAPLPVQPVQEQPSEWEGIKEILDEYGLQAIDFVADFKAALAQPPLPVQREWVGLTDEEIHGTPWYNETHKTYQFALSLIAKLKERNS